MATALTPQNTTLAAPLASTVAVVFAAAAVAGNYFANDGKCIAILKAATGQQVATFVTQAKYQGYALADRTLTVVATTGFAVDGPFDPALFNDANGLCQITYDGVTGMSIAIVQLPN